MFAITREAVSVFGFSIHFYGIVIALGVYLAIVLSEKREQAFDFPKETVITLAIIAIPAAIIAARLYYVLFSFDEYKANPVSILDIRSGGLAIYGGLIGGVLAGFIFSKVKKLSFLRLADLAAPAIALGQAIGRWGNFFNQEAYGIAITDPRMQFFPLAVFIQAKGAYFAATFFYESAWCFLIVLLCLLLEKKRAFRFPGAEISFYACMYAFERMLVEGLRTDSLYAGTFRISQVLSAGLLFIVCLCLIAIRTKNGGKRFFRLMTAALAFTAIVICAFGIVSPIWLLPSGLILLCLSLNAVFA